MKNTPLILSIIALLGVVALGICQLVCNKGQAAPVAEGEQTETAAHAGAIVYFSLDRVLNEYDMANDLRTTVESKVQSIQQEVTRRSNRLQKDANDFQEKINKGLITRSVAEVQQQKLLEQQQQFQNYAAQKEQEVAEEQQVMMNQIGDAIKKFVDKYNETHGYAMIVATQGDVLPAPIVTADPALDITDDLLAGLNDEYIKTKTAEK
ncbi:MAG: OmpH family outer membrane protein [Bacteroidales bacterium]|nr:OmpH family outer membrane protein [Bacteroidales bacterium]